MSDGKDYSDLVETLRVLATNGDPGWNFHEESADAIDALQLRAEAAEAVVKAARAIHECDPGDRGLPEHFSEWQTLWQNLEEALDRLDKDSGHE